VHSLLITGATGYIGGELADYYVKQGFKVTLLVRDPEKIKPELAEVCTIFKGNVTAIETIHQAVSGQDAVIHSAGLLGHWGVSYKELYDVNVQGTLNLIKSAFESGVSRFVHLSAGGVTGPLNKKAADETCKPHPFTAYEKTKWEGEKKALELAERENLNLLALRPTFTYGPADPHKLGLFKAVLKGRFAYIGDGLSTVHPVFIEDLIHGIDLGLHATQKQKSLILGGPKPVTKIELISGIAAALGVNEPKFHIPTGIAYILAVMCECSSKLLKFTPPLTRSRILALSRNWGYSIDRARSELGYEPQTGLQEGLKRTAAWYQEHEWL
jgi:nucleoside-diphosphate-sugar epimerase